ncbi:MAG: DNA-directed RNA polymerase subunit D [Nanoarchaeota archaeon]|nr:DNA-directed RNA polymerase subunit D [Nanoarchaeota archaeon]
MNGKQIKLDNKKGKGTFLLQNTAAWYVNTIRRYIINKVPTMAMEDIEFIENSSALYDEIVAHRLGLIPLVTDLVSYFEKEKCKCKGKGCARCTLKLTLNKMGPCTVYAGDLKSMDPKVVPAYPKMPIVKLLEGQSLKFEATAQLGSGKDHIKFSPGHIYYYGYPIIKTKENKDAKLAVASCPKNILEIKGKKLSIKDIFKCDLCLACTDACPEAITVEGSDKDFIIKIESWLQLSIKEIMIKAAEMFNEDLDNLANAIKKLK